MKRTCYLLLFLVLILVFNKNSLAQSTTTMQDIMETISSKVAALEDDNNKEIVNMTFDLLVNDGKKTIWRNLDPSFTYDLLVIGDRRISRMKVAVYKQSKDTWESVGEAAGSSPKMKITPTEFEQYEFSVSVEEFKSGKNTGHFALLLYHENPEKNK